MAHSVEARAPFLDAEWVEWTARLPDRYKVRGLKTKWLLTAAFVGKLPPEILKRGKQVFSLPIGLWLRHELRDGIHRLELAFWDAEYGLELRRAGGPTSTSFLSGAQLYRKDKRVLVDLSMAMEGNQDHDIIVQCFAVVVIGGFGSMLGTFVASIIVGVVYSFSILFWPDGALAMIFLILIVVLIWRPWGLFGTELRY